MRLPLNFKTLPSAAHLFLFLTFILQQLTTGMKMILKLLLTCLLCFFSIGLLYALFVIIYPWITEYNPDEVAALSETAIPEEKLPSGQEYSILSWNIGYAGLGREMDFFYEGGKMVRPDRVKNEEYLNGILHFFKSYDTLDFIFLQEVDFRSSRSYKINQYSALGNRLNAYRSDAAINYKSAFVPSPILNPMGKVEAGQATFSRFSPTRAFRQATPGAYSWPMRLYMLKRCFLVSRFSLDNGRELVLFNIHNSAFDDASSLREQELELLKTMITEEYEKGNYVVVGGDWNQNPPGWNPFPGSKYITKAVWPIEETYLGAGWSWAFDPSLPTNRDVDQPFSAGKTPCSLLDFFVVSPNIRVNSLHTIDLEFRDSDHLPVLMTFQLL